MKRKISTLFVMTLFILSLVPAALAQDANSEPVAKMGKDIAVTKATVKDGRIVHKDLRVRHMKLREATKSRDRSAIKADVTALRDMKGEFDGDKHVKAMTVVKHAMDTIETMSIHFERLKARYKNSEELQQAHPNAITRIDNVLDELGSMYASLSEVISDDKVTGQEWRTTVVPILKKIKPKADHLRDHKDFKDARGQQVKDFVHRLRSEVSPKVRARHIARGLTEAEADARVAKINTELKDFESKSRTEQLARLERIRSAMK